MLFRRFLTLILAAVLLATMATAVAAEPAPKPGEDPRTSGERDRFERLEPFARLKIGKGSELMFFEMMADTGRPEGIGMARYIPVGGMDPASVRELHDANPHEYFYAASHPGTEIPGVLRTHYENRFGKRQQGWALEKFKPGFKLFSCALSEQAIVNAVNATGLPYSYNELSEGPHNGPFWFVEDPNALFPTYYKNNGLATVGDAYFHVMLCEEDPAFLNSSVHVRLSYEESDDGTILGQGELHWALHNPGDQMSFMSWPFDSDLSGDNIWFWMLTVSGVHHHDTLHIGTAWS